MSFNIKSLKKISLLLVLSILFTVFVPATSNAGILSSLLNTVRPVAGIAGNIAGAIAGATMCSAVCPPLGTLAGAIGGYFIGGVLGNYLSGGLTNIATLGGAALGVMACASMGPIGYVIGALGGAFLGRTAMGLLNKLDNKVTGGMLFSPATDAAGNAVSVGSTANSVAVVTEVAAPVSNGEIPSAYNEKTDSTLNVEVANSSSENETEESVSEAYQRSYKAYLVAVRTGTAEEIKEAYAAYKAAYNKYKDVTGKYPDKK